MLVNQSLESRFEENRARLWSVAYRMLGSTSEADDAVQETWIRLARADSDRIENLEGWLTTVVSRVSLDMLRVAGIAPRGAPRAPPAGSDHRGDRRDHRPGPRGGAGRFGRPGRAGRARDAVAGGAPGVRAARHVRRVLRRDRADRRSQRVGDAPAREPGASARAWRGSRRSTRPGSAPRGGRGVPRRGAAWGLRRVAGPPRSRRRAARRLRREPCPRRRSTARRRSSPTPACTRAAPGRPSWCRSTVCPGCWAPRTVRSWRSSGSPSRRDGAITEIFILADVERLNRR